jgi:regulator of protease activity HflC (stomatin/prohibitin superfamily)
MPEYTLLLFALVVLFFISRGARIVPQGYEFTVERFGRYTHTLTPGFHLIIPLVDRVGAKVNMMESVMDVPTQDVITRDNAAVAVDGIVFLSSLGRGKVGL